MEMLIAAVSAAWPVLLAILSAAAAFLYGARQGDRNAQAREDARRVKQTKARDKARKDARDMTDEDISDLLTGRRKP